jgi:hypothetical protein
MMVDEEYLNLFDKPETKVCTQCKKSKLLTEFYKDNRSAKQGNRLFRNQCKTCYKKRDLNYRERKPFNQRCVDIKRHAIKKKLPFNLTVEYLESVWTEKCPVLGIELDIFNGKTGDNSAQMDRLVPDKGYVKGNVSWLSFRANRLKSNATALEHIKIGLWMLGEFNDG